MWRILDRLGTGRRGPAAGAARRAAATAGFVVTAGIAAAILKPADTLPGRLRITGRVPVLGLGRLDPRRRGLFAAAAAAAAARPPLRGAAVRVRRGGHLSRHVATGRPLLECAPAASSMATAAAACRLCGSRRCSGLLLLGGVTRWSLQRVTQAIQKKMSKYACHPTVESSTFFNLRLVRGPLDVSCPLD